MLPVVTVRRHAPTARLLMAALLCGVSSYAIANPVDGVVVGGSATISEAGKTLTVDQHTDRAIVDWRSFDIEVDETTRFNQPHSGAVALNRVNNNDPSKIMGTLSANGNIILVNPNGVFFGKDSKVDVNGLVATTADIANDKFMAGGMHFDKPGNPNATITNAGTITAKEAGLVGLVAPNVVNSGVITAKLGRVQLASGDTTTVDLYGDGLLEVKASDALTSQLVEHSGVINAEGGTIALTAAAGRELVNSTIKVTGELHAPSVGSQQGKIIIAAEGANAVIGNEAVEKGKKSGASTVLISGKIDVSSADGQAGKVEITGDRIALLNGARIDASGATGGGVVHVGGEYLGQGETPTALYTIVQDDVQVNANATVNGYGGEVIMYADERTEFGGSITANGAGDGDGGFVETSGRVALLVYGRVTAISERGRKGTWLLDPADLEIVAGSTNSNATGNPNWTPTGTASQVGVINITNALDAGTNVTLTTSNDSFAGNGDITVNAAITTTGNGSLTLNAYRDIVLNSAINLRDGNFTATAGRDINIAADVTKASGTGTADYSFYANRNISNSSSKVVKATSGAVNMLFNADRNGDGGSTDGGAINFSGGTFTSNGGNITLGGGNGTITGVVLNADGTVNTAATGFAVGNAQTVRGISLSSALAAGAGSIILNGQGYGGTTSSNEGVYINANVSTTSGAVRVSGTSASSSGIMVLNTVTTGTGLIQMLGRAGNNTDIGGVNVLGTVSATGNGNITLSGFGTNAGGSGLGIKGVWVNTGRVTAAGGDIVLWGTGANTTGAYNFGVGIENGSATVSNTTGSITVTGYGGGSGSGGSNRGIYIDAIVETTQGGAIQMTGIGGGLSSGNAYNDGIAAYHADSIRTNGGSIILKGVKGGGSDSFGVRSINTNGITTTATTYGSGAITIYADTLLVDLTNAINAIGALQLASYSNMGMSVGNTVVSTFNVSAANLGYINAASYVFGSTTTADGVTANTGDVTVNTTKDFGDKNVTFISGNDINIAGDLSRGTGGTGTVTYLFRANRDIYNSNSAGVLSTSTNGKNHIILNADYDQLTAPGGGVYLAGGTLQSRGGDITIGGGTNPLTGYALGGGGYVDGIRFVNVALQASSSSGAGGKITVNGQGAAAGGIGVVRANGNWLTNDNDVIINGVGTGSNSGVSSGSSGYIRITNGNLLINANSAGSNISMLLGSSSLQTLTSGNIVIKAANGGLNLSSSSALISSAGNTTIYSNGYSATSGASIAAEGMLTLASYSNQGISLGSSVASTTNIDNTMLGYINGASYVFGSTTTADGVTANTGDVTINTTKDFANKNVTFISGNDILLNGTLTKGTGTGVATYNFYANRHIANASGVGIVISPGGINLTLDADRDTNGTGTLNWTGATSLATGTGSITAQDAMHLAGDLTLTGTGVTLNGTVDGDTAGMRSLTVNAGTGTFTTTGIIGGSNKLNNLSITADDVMLGADVYGGGTLTLQPTSSTRAVNVATAGANDLNLTATEIGYFKEGWGSILIGRGTTSSASMNIGTVNFIDPVTFRNSTGYGIVGSTLSTSDNATLSFTPGTLTLIGNINADGAISMGNLSNTGTITTTNDNITLQNWSRGGTIDAGTATLTVNGTITTNQANRDLTANAGTFIFGATSDVTDAGGFALRNVLLTSLNSITLPSITASKITVQTTGAAADLTIASGKTLTATGTGDALTLAAGRNFINNAGSTVLSAANGRWLVYSANMADNTRGGLMPDASEFGKTYAGNAPVTIGAGNRFIYSSSTAPTLVLDTDNDSVTYGDAYGAGDLSYSYVSGLVGGDTWGNIGLTGSAGLSTTYVQGTTGYNASAYSNMITGTAGTLASVLGYHFSFTGGDLTVNKRTITVGLTGAVTKEYDATLGATLASGDYSLTNRYGSDDVLVSGTGVYDTKDVGTGKTVSFTGLTLAGSAADNYQLASTSASGAVGVITKKALTVTGAPVSVVYGNAIPTATTLNFTGFAGSEGMGAIDVVPTISSTLSGVVDVGSYAGNYQLVGGSATNYRFNYVGGNLTVTPRALVVGTYNAAKLTSQPDPTFSGYNDLLAGDAAQISWTYTAAGYSGNAGTYSIIAVANDPNHRLANYTRTNQYGTFTVTLDVPPPPAIADAPLPDTVLKGFSIPPVYQQAGSANAVSSATTGTVSSTTSDMSTEWVNETGQQWFVDPELKTLLQSSI